MPFKAVFTLEAHGTTAARTTLELTAAVNGFTLISHTEPVGLMALIRSEQIRERSQLERHGASWRPVTYSYRRHGGSKERRSDARFDWSAGEVAGSAKGQPFTYAVSRGMLDPLSYLLALMRDAADDAPQRRYAIAGNSVVRNYRFDAVPGEPVVSEAGRFETVGWRRQGRKNRVTTVFLAPSLEHFPVRIHHREKDGTELTLTLQDLVRQRGP